MTIRVSRHHLEHCRRRALEEGWRLADLVRTLICLGATVYFLRLRNAKAVDNFMRLSTLNRMNRALVRATGRGRGGRRESAQLGGSALQVVHLPPGLHRLASAYSAATGTSRNALLSRFFDAGFILYMLGQETLLKTLCSLQEERKQHPEADHDEYPGDRDAIQDDR